MNDKKIIKLFWKKILKDDNGTFYWGFENNIKERYKVMLIKTVNLNW